jgi:beta-lactamase regulating signal transducer with metallopeptidase domain
MIQALGITLIEFVLQGTLIALLLAAFLALAAGASARLRYAASCLALAALLAVPAIRFAHALGQAREGPFAQPALAARTEDPAAPIVAAPAPSPLSLSFDPQARVPLLATPRLVPLLPWVVALWALGVAAISARLLAGWTFTLRLRRRIERLGERETLLLSSLAERLGVKRALAFGSSALIEVPTVVGWLRPALLVPASSLCGLSAPQLEALLAHELAHVRRHDALVNFLQTAVETLLFYHPAVWWVSRRIRAERENCCDDAAVAATGDPLSYARALVALEELRQTPALALGADGGSLLERVRRLTGGPRRRSSAALLAGLGALALAALAAHGAFDTTGHTLTGPGPSPRAKPAPAMAAAARPEPGRAVAAEHVTVRPHAAALAAVGPAPDAEEDADAAPEEQQTPAPSTSPAPDGLPTVDELIRLRQHGVTPEFLDQMSALGYTTRSIAELIRLRDLGVTPEYVRGMREAGFRNLPAALLIELRQQGVGPDFARAFAALGYREARDLIRLRQHGVSPEWVKEMKDLGYSSLSIEDLVRLRGAGVMPDLVRGLAKHRS